MIYENLNDDNFLLYAAKYYDNPQIHSTEEFLEDIGRIKYIKKLITRYIDCGDLKERLILNHIIILHNVFGDHAVRILYLKMKKQFYYIKPFLVMLNIMPLKIMNVGSEKVVDTDMIGMDSVIISKLRDILHEKI